MTDAGPTPTAPKRLSAFISHHSSQVETARRLKRLLAARGIDGWLAPDDIAAGTAFDQSIVDQIDRSDAIVLLFCPQSDQSRHVKRELMLGEDSNKTILPVLVAAGAGAIWWKSGSQAGGDPGAAVADDPIEPGIWTSKREVVKILFPEEIAPEYEKQFKTLMETDPDPEDCISAEVAAKPDVKLFDPNNESSCTIGSFKMNGGRISGYLNCKIAGDPNGNLQVTVRGTYTRTSMEYDNVVTMQTSQGMVRFRSHETSNWVRGPACST